MSKLMMRIFGANWKTTVSGIGSAAFSILGAVASLPYDFGKIADLFPPAYKGRVAITGFAAGFLLKVWNSVQQKSKDVTGGVVQQTADGKVADPVELGGPSQSVVDTIKAEPKE